MDILSFWTDKILDFLRSKKFKVDPAPQIEFIDNVANDKDNILIKTGYYDPIAKKIVLFTDGRHMKDILRSFVHELVHHHQNLTNRNLFKVLDMSGSIEKNSQLRKVEAEAYLLGNLYFRMFTEQFIVKDQTSK